MPRQSADVSCSVGNAPANSKRRNAVSEEGFKVRPHEYRICRTRRGVARSCGWRLESLSFLCSPDGSRARLNWGPRKHSQCDLEPWYAGEEGGAESRRLFAKQSAGRLPVTFYTGGRQLPSFEELRNEGAYLIAIRRQAPLSVWIRPELHDFSLQLLSLRRANRGGRSFHLGSEGYQHRQTRRR